MAAITAASPVASGTFQPDADIHVTFEDQQKINKFARQNARLEDLLDELKAKENELENLKFAESELVPDDTKVPYMLGEVFVGLEYDDAEKMLENVKKNLEDEIKAMLSQADGIKNVMTGLKTQLYAKFGNNINLEPDE